MKLGELNQAIRSLDGAPKIDLNYHPAGGDAQLMGLELTKSSLLAAIKVTFAEHKRTEETGLRIDEEGYLKAISDDDEQQASGEGDSVPGTP